MAASEKLPDSEDQELRMPLWEHLDDLRSGIIRSLLVLLAGVGLTYSFVEKLIYYLEKPLLDVLPPGEDFLYFTGIADKFLIYIKVSFIAAIALFSPYLLWELWRFIAPGLRKHEKKAAVPFIFLGSVSFMAGIAFGYFVVLPYSYDFLIHFGSPNDKAMITLKDYFDLTTKLLLALGLIFEMPSVLILLANLGIIEVEQLVKFRKQAVVVISVLAAIITPSPDAMTMLIVMAPLYLLYEISILGVRWVQRKKPSSP